MKYEKFKGHKIKRTCKEHFDKYSKYRPYLEEDFHERCCYCNMPSDLLTISYHVEHFIPVKAFEGKKDSLLTEYENLMWACPKCNLSKGDKYKGDFENSCKIENELFYNPVEVDFNDIFLEMKLEELNQKMLRVVK